VPTPPGRARSSAHYHLRRRTDQRIAAQNAAGDSDWPTRHPQAHRPSAVRSVRDSSPSTQARRAVAFGVASVSRAAVVSFRCQRRRPRLSLYDRYQRALECHRARRARRGSQLPAGNGSGHCHRCGPRAPARIDPDNSRTQLAPPCAGQSISDGLSGIRAATDLAGTVAAIRLSTLADYAEAVLKHRDQVTHAFWFGAPSERTALRSRPIGAAAHRQFTAEDLNTIAVKSQ
jgi:hypothetical protein